MDIQKEERRTFHTVLFQNCDGLCRCRGIAWSMMPESENFLDKIQDLHKQTQKTSNNASKDPIASHLNLKSGPKKVRVLYLRYCHESE
eukprot:scaffold4511_cov171-Amphora_coffeaeformis.AAC.17